MKEGAGEKGMLKDTMAKRSLSFAHLGRSAGTNGAFPKSGVPFWGHYNKVHMTCVAYILPDIPPLRSLEYNSHVNVSKASPPCRDIVPNIFRREIAVP